jgi:hypothetical protein
MNNDAVLVIVPLIISGLGFLVYKHPVLTRWIVIGIAILFVFINTLSHHTTIARLNGFVDSRRTLDTIQIYETLRRTTYIADVNLDSLDLEDPLFNEPRIDTSTDYTRDHWVKIMLLKHFRDQTNRAFRASTDRLIAKSIEDEHRRRISYFWALGGCAVFFILSFLFQKLHRPKRKERNNKPNKTPY